MRINEDIREIGDQGKKPKDKASEHQKFGSSKGLLLICLARLSLGEPPVAPYPASGRPSGPQFPLGPGSQDFPEVIDGRSLSSEQANHRIHFNLFKDHETKKTKGNIAFKLGQGDGVSRNDGGQNFANFQGGSSDLYSSPGRSGVSDKFGAPQNNPLSRQYGTPNLNQQTYPGQGQDLTTRYGPPSQFSGLSSQYGAPQQRNQNQQGQYSQDYQTDYRSGSDFGRQQSQSSRPQSQYGPPQGFSNGQIYSNRPAESYGAPHSAGQSGKTSFQQPSSSYGTPSQFQRNSQPSQSYGSPNHGQNLFGRKMDQYQQRNHQFNSADRYNNFQKQSNGLNLNGDRSSDDMTVTEKANYEFEYEVRGEQSHGHEESREGDEAWGSYKVQLPDGRTMLVEYTADDRGYRPKITYSGQENDQQAY